MKLERELQKELLRWQEKQIISPQQAEQIRLLYPVEKKSSYNIILIIFSIVGALLIGGGIILILGTNWDNLPIWFRTVLAFLPLLVSQGITVFLLLRKVQSETWREGVGVFYSISIYACIAMVEQIYQLPTNFSRYVLLCSILILPVCYVLKATIPLLIYMTGIVIWQSNNNIYYLALFALAIPHIYSKFKANLYSAYSQLILWCLGICGFVLSITTFSFAEQHFLVISLYFSMLYLISVKWMDNEKPLMLNPLKIIGFIGNIVTLMFMSNRYISSIFFRTVYPIPDEWLQIVVVTIMALLSFFLMIRTFDIKTPLKSLQTFLIGAVFLIALIMKIIMPNDINNWYWFHYALLVSVNIYILAIGVLLILNGLHGSRFSLACLGTTIISIIIVWRFFDTAFDFYIRGFIFIVVGILFLLSNVFISRKIRKAVPNVERN